MKFLEHSEPSMFTVLHDEHSELCCLAQAVVLSRAAESGPDVWTGAHCELTLTAIPPPVLSGDSSSFGWIPFPFVTHD